jgi:DNA-binding FrmR family transcriptional regulator
MGMPRKTTHKESHRAMPREAEARQGLLLRLRRVEGQVRGVQKMVEDERYCPDVLVQMSAIHESLRAVERILMKDHLQHCATEALRSGDAKQAQRTYDELTELFYRHVR